MKNIIKIIFISVSVLLAFTLHAAQLPSNISPQQLAQFKKLPPAQQKSLAKSMGLDIRAIQAQLNTSSNKLSPAENEPQLQQYYPRGTQFDQFGEPIFTGDDLNLYDNEKDQLKPFGYDVFANAPMNFMAPSNDVVAPLNYLVGSNDTLSIQIYGKENVSYELVISNEGEVVIPQLGPFAIAGMTITEVKAFLTSEIQNTMLGVDVIITLTKLRSLRVFILGEAFKPGPYILSSLSSITHALFAAGGINAIGSLRNIQLKRAGKLITTLDLYDLLIAGDSSNDVILESGDVIFIAPVGDRVTLDGQVKRSAIYELKGGETFQTMIEMSGGLLPSAFPSATVVEGFTKNNLRSVRSVDLTKKTNLALKVNGGDVIKIMKTSELYENSVTLIGAFTRPGKYQWQEGQRLSDLIPNAHSYLLADADLAYGLIVREKDRARNIELLQFDFSNVISSKKSQDNLLLKPLDRVIIFSINENKQRKFEQLDNLAFTRKELNNAEKEFAKDNYDERSFWREYGDENDATLKQLQTNTDDGFSKNLEEFSKNKAEKTVLQQLNPFSRQRILLPIIKRLKQQAASGEPMQLVEVDGSVKYPGIYPLAINAKVDDLLKASGGLLESAYLNRAEITRNYLINNQVHKESIKIDLADVLSENKERNLKLFSKDHLTVLQIPSWQENHIIELRGEFIFPGKYTIKRGETLGSLIERVSGFTDYAYTEAAVFTRIKLKQLEQQNIRKVAENLRAEIASKSLAQNNGSQAIDYSQAKLLLADLRKVTPIGRLVVNIPDLKEDKTLDVLLEDGDVVYVPSRQNSVNVIGQIQVASSHIYQNDLSAFDYIALSGGIKKQADEERIYVIKANGSVAIPTNGNWFASSAEQALKAGDTVVVPLDSDYMNSLTLWSTGTQIIYQAAVAIAAISGI